MSTMPAVGGKISTSPYITLWSIPTYLEAGLVDVIGLRSVVSSRVHAMTYTGPKTHT